MKKLFGATLLATLLLIGAVILGFGMSAGFSAASALLDTF